MIEDKIENLTSIIKSCSKGLESSEIKDGWIIILKSGTGDVNFDRRWKDYRNGFGSLDGDYWLGLEEMHKLTRDDNYKLQVDIQYYDKSWKYAIYDNFEVENENEKYKLKLGTYNKASTEEDGLTYHDGRKFSTSDSDNDGRDINCADLNKSGWWYHQCYRSKLTGIALPEGTDDVKGIVWNNLTGKTVKAAIMKIRRI